MAEIDLTPTEEMAANAARGLELRRKHGKGGTEIGVARARDISNRKNLSPETVRRMHAFFSRHEKNKAGGEDDAGYIAWLLWGGDSGQSWAKRKVEQMDKGENQRSDTYKEIAQRLGSAAKMAVDAGWRVSPDAKSSGLTVAELLPKLAKGHTFYANLKSGGTVSGTLKAFSTSGVKIDKYGDVTDLRWSDIASIGAGNIGTGPYPIRASRPGAKAEMARDLKVRKGNFTDAVAIVGQNGGGSASFYAGLILRHKDGEEQVLWMKHGYSTEKAAERAALQRFDAHVSRMSRPGAKAKMGRTSEEYAEDVQNTWAIISRWVDSLRSPLMMENYREARQIVSKLAQVFARFEKELASPVTRLSRPGAKAKMGKQWREGPYAFKNKLLAEDQMQLLVNEGSGWMNAGVFMDESDTIEASKSYVEMRKRGFVYEHGQWNKARASRPGAKIANAVREGEKVSASDDAVSRKIRKLMDEGKPQKQAVAIALDLERKGEL